MSLAAGLDVHSTRFSREVRDNRPWIMATGILLVLLGSAAILFPLGASLAVERVIGAVLAVSGLTELVRGVRLRSRKGLRFGLLSGILALVAGGLLLLFPLTGVITLTLVVGVFFIAGGLLRVLLAVQLRPYDHWGWLLLSGVLALTLGAWTLLQWPTAAALVIGLLVGIDLIFAGWISIFLALHADPLA